MVHHIRALREHRQLVPAFIAAIVFLANMLATQVGWKISKQRVERQIHEIGEIYLDGMVASIKGPQEAGMHAEVGRRLRAAFTEQHGIQEKLLVVSDSAGATTNMAGRKELATDAVLNADPGSYSIDLETNTLVVARRLDGQKSRAIAVLNIEKIMHGYTLSQWSMIGANVGLATLTGVAALLLMFGAGLVGNTPARKPVAETA